MRYTKALGAAFLLAFFLIGCTKVARISDDTLEMAREHEVPIVFTWIRPGSPNSAGGVDAHVYFVNATDQPIRYVRIDVGAFNAVGDPVASSIGRRHVGSLNATGPFAPGRGNGGLTRGAYWTNVWYNHSIRCIEVLKVEVEFMDRSKRVMDPDDVANALQRGVRNNCRDV